MLKSDFQGCVSLGGSLVDIFFKMCVQDVFLLPLCYFLEEGFVFGAYSSWIGGF